MVSWLQHGYRLPWLRGPPPAFNQGKSFGDLNASQHSVLTTQLQHLLDVGALEPGRSSRYVTRAFLVPKPGGKWRLVVDLRHLNSFLRKTTCRFETLKRLRTLVREDDWMISLDLQDGFYAVGVHPADRQFLTVDVAGYGLLQFAALPMGLSASPFVFTKVMRTFVQALRSPLLPAAPGALSRLSPRHRPRPPPAGLPLGDARSRTPRLVSDLRHRFQPLMETGLRVLPYMDDFLVLTSSYAEALQARSYVQAVLDVLGLRRHPGKGEWEPVQTLKHLGLGIDTKKGIFFVTPDRLQKMKALAKEILGRAARNARRVPVRLLASFSGLTQSFYLAVPPARFFNRSLHDVISSRKSWSSLVTLSRTALHDLDWYLHLPERWNGRSILRVTETALLHTDASMLGWGAFLNQKSPAHGFWRHLQRRHHISMLELKAVRFAVESYLPQLRGRTVLLREDNQVVVALLSNWTSRSPEMFAELRKLFFLLDTNDITIRPLYIRSADNIADVPSRMSDSSDWKLHPEEFALLNLRFGPHSVDRFATANNAHLQRYNSLMADPGSEALDAFAQSYQLWRDENNFCNPPWELLEQLARFLYDSGAAATVIAPYWPAQIWFQMLNDMCSEITILPDRQGMFLPGRLGSTVALGKPGWPVACFRVPLRLPSGKP